MRENVEKVNERIVRVKKGENVREREKTGEKMREKTIEKVREGDNWTESERER